MDAAQRAYGYRAARPPARLRPVDSPEGRDYLAAMAGAANFAFANRQVMMHPGARAPSSRSSGRAVERLGVGLVYDVAPQHRQAREHDGRRGRSRCLRPPQGGDAGLRPGSPGGARRSTATSASRCIIPGDMGTRELAAGRHRDGHDRDLRLDLPRRRPAALRGAARKVRSGSEVRRELEERGILVRAALDGAAGRRGALRLQGRGRDRGHRAEALGLSRRVARLKPLGVLKG